MHDVVLLAGGSSRRMTTGGGDATADKLTLRDDSGRSLLDASIAGALGTAAAAVIVVGPRRPSEIDAGEGADNGAGTVLWRCEEPPGGGPVAGIAAGIAATTSPVVVVSAGDAPASAEALPDLLATVSAATAAVLLDAGGRRSLCLAARRADLVTALATLGDPRGVSVGRLLAEVESAGVRLVEVPDVWGAAADVDTPDDAERLGWRS